MKGFRRFVVAIACASAVAGCGEIDSAPSETSSVDGAVRPMTRFKDEEKTKALRGLVYDSGRVVRDEPAASELLRGLSASDAEAEFQRGAELLRGNRRLEAVAAFTKAVLLEPSNAGFYSGLGDALLLKGLEDQALAAYHTGLDLESDSVDLHFKLADALARGGDAEGAVLELRSVIALAPQNGEAHKRLAMQLYYLEDDAGAWSAVHACEDLEYPVPPQFRALLERRSSEPAR